MNFIDKRYKVGVTSDILYGSAGVGYNDGQGPVRERELRMDRYAPLDAPPGPRPAIVLAFGGAFHRGSKEDDAVLENGQGNTTIASYCALFAARGYVCFSIDYRLTQEDPDPGPTRILGDEDVPRSRIDFVRDLLGLSPSTPEMIRRVQEAGSDDMATAFMYVAAHADELGVDPGKIAIGGFSAGGRIAMNAAFGEGITPFAVIGLSSYVPNIVLDQFLDRGADSIPVFIGRGEQDLDYVCRQTALMSERLKAAGIVHRLCVVPGSGHFYPATAMVQASDGVAGTLEESIAGFLQSSLAGTGNSKERSHVDS